MFVLKAATIRFDQVLITLLISIVIIWNFTVIICDNFPYDWDDDFDGIISPVTS